VDRVPGLLDDQAPAPIVSDEDIDEVRRIGRPHGQLKPADCAANAGQAEEQFLNGQVASIHGLVAPIAGEFESRLQAKDGGEGQPDADRRARSLPELEAADLALAESDHPAKLRLRDASPDACRSQPLAKASDRFVRQAVDLDREVRSPGPCRAIHTRRMVTQSSCPPVNAGFAASSATLVDPVPAPRVSGASV
jgi:hypothetical protein